MKIPTSMMVLVSLLTGTSLPAMGETVLTTFEFTVYQRGGYSFGVGAKGSGWFTYDNTIPGRVYLNSQPVCESYGYYAGEQMYIAVGDEVVYSGSYGIVMYDNYSENVDAFHLRSSYKIPPEIDFSWQMLFNGPTTLWSSLPSMLPVMNFAALDTRQEIRAYNRNAALGGVQDKTMNAWIDSVTTSTVPLPSVFITGSTLLAIVGAGWRRRALWEEGRS